MSENTRNIKEIFEELFKGTTSALSKYARVRMTQYEMLLWRKHGLPINEVDKTAKSYFTTKFLAGKRIADVSPEELDKAFDSLDHAVKDGCHGRCFRLMTELNEAYVSLGLSPVNDIDSFLNFVTFSYEVRKDDQGQAIIEKPYGFEIRLFNSEQNRKELWAELQSLMKQGRIMSLQEASKIILHKRRLSKPL